MELCRILPDKLLYGSQFWPWLHFKPSQQMWLGRRKQIQNKIWSNPIKLFPTRIDLNCEGMVWCLITIQSSAGGIYEDINQRRNGYDRVILLERSRAILIWWDLSKSCGSYGQAQKVRVWWSETEKCRKLTLSNPFSHVLEEGIGKLWFLHGFKLFHNVCLCSHKKWNKLKPCWSSNSDLHQNLNQKLTEMQ